MNFNFTAPTIKIDTKGIQGAGKTVREAINAGNKLNAICKLSNYKMLK